ncbi:MAG TPA: hypothetical protein EYP14_06920 [Planctomycetaceae bacterium]|nr:hypothetical protein [Planctomycetaceae bacterium]
MRCQKARKRSWKVRKARWANITCPDGRQYEIALASDQTSWFARTDRVGIYRVDRPGLPPLRYAVNLFSPKESDLSRVDGLRLGERRLRAEGGPIETNREIWTWLALLALLVLAIEWHMY